MSNNFFGTTPFIWWLGVVEDRKDPQMLGRVRVRIFGHHTDLDNPESKEKLPTENLQWALFVAPADDGQNIHGFKESDWVVGFFLDGEEKQRPCIIGKLHGVPTKKAEPDKAYNDPTSDKELECLKVPRPPEMCPPLIDSSSESEDASSSTQANLGAYRNPDKLPGSTTGFGVLLKDIEGNPKKPKNFKFDVNNDGIYDDTDAELLAWDANRDGKLTGKEAQKDYTNFVGFTDIAIRSVPISRYPLEHKLNEPTISRLARNEKIEETIVALKKSNLASAESANFVNAGFGTGAISTATSFGEPETQYNAVYPYNHVYESESGHVLEVDDTPGAERLHRYHRTGTFEEIHPNGIRVDKTVNDQYNVAVKNYYHISGEDTRISADQNVRIKGASEIVVQSGGPTSLEVGGNLNENISEDKNVLIKGDHWYFNAGEATLYVEKPIKLFCKDKISVKAESDMILESAKNLSVVAGSDLLLKGSKVCIEGKAYGADMSVAIAEQASVLGASPVPVTCELVENDAEEFELEEPETATTQPGFILDAPKSGDLYKPISESDGKLVCLSESAEQIKLYHAVPTGELEQVEIKYLHEDLSITSWTVVRPVHTFEESGLIEAGRSTGSLGNRSVWRFSKPGKEYPKQMIMVTGSKPDGWLILNSAIRHD